MVNLSDEDYGTIRTSWRRVAPLSALLVDLFYDRLFLKAPHLRPLFSKDLSGQKAKMVDTLSGLVEVLERPDGLEGRITTLAKTHAIYGALPEHYDLVGEALLTTLAELDAVAIRPSELRAWKRFYAEIARRMIDEQERLKQDV
ncbi:MAG: globin domain-containing protein [Pseudomonadota bacterium]